MLGSSDPNQIHFNIQYLYSVVSSTYIAWYPVLI